MTRVDPSVALEKGSHFIFSCTFWYHLIIPTHMLCNRELLCTADANCTYKVTRRFQEQLILTKLPTVSMYNNNNNYA